MSVVAHIDQAMPSDPQNRVASFRMTVAPIGDVIAHHGSSIMAGTMEVDDAERIVLQVAMPGCKCGCDAPGVALFHLPAPHEARAIAQRLWSEADRLEATAASAASAIIAKAARK